MCFGGLLTANSALYLLEPIKKRDQPQKAGRRHPAERNISRERRESPLLSTPKPPKKNGKVEGKKKKD